MPRVKRTKRNTHKKKYHRGGEGYGEAAPYENPNASYGYGENYENPEETIPEQPFSSYEGFGSEQKQEQEQEPGVYPQEQEPSDIPYSNTGFSPMEEPQNNFSQEAPTQEKEQSAEQFGIPSMGFGAKDNENSEISSMDSLNQFVGAVGNDVTKPGLKDKLTQGLGTIIAKLKNWSMGNPKTELLQTGGTRKRRQSKKKRTQKKRTHKKRKGRKSRKSKN